MLRTTLATAFAFIGYSTAVPADPMQDFVTRQMDLIAASPAIMAAVANANEAHAGVTEADVIALDETWRQEIASASRPLISNLTGSDASMQLRMMVKESEGRIAEIIVMDTVGLNAAISGITSDYWQGDEAKHQETFGAGPTGAHTSDVELDASTGVYAVQASRTLLDPDSGEPVGAVTFGLDSLSF
ncbi:hypothetical protein PAA8504_01679 [Palleronia abyssalis]|uniref:Uncharacterized protein n=2 Tax=Palleronia abyssalis TaxID=1501240 RepID=A0A2R8BUM9_9RHOB|nr:hypothetical protein PAA8504_01679 [Palleronia abyssalis]